MRNRALAQPGVELSKNSSTKSQGEELLGPLWFWNPGRVEWEDTRDANRNQKGREDKEGLREGAWCVRCLDGWNMPRRNGGTWPHGKN